MFCVGDQESLTLFQGHVLPIYYSIVSFEGIRFVQFISDPVTASQ